MPLGALLHQGLGVLPCAELSLDEAQGLDDQVLVSEDVHVALLRQNQRVAGAVRELMEGTSLGPAGNLM